MSISAAMEFTGHGALPSCNTTDGAATARYCYLGCLPHGVSQRHLELAGLRTLSFLINCARETIVKPPLAAAIVAFALSLLSPFVSADSGLQQGDSPNYGHPHGASRSNATTRAAGIGEAADYSAGPDRGTPQNSRPVASTASSAPVGRAAEANVAVPVGDASSYLYTGSRFRLR